MGSLQHNSQRFRAVKLKLGTDTCLGSAKKSMFCVNYVPNNERFSTENSENLCKTAICLRERVAFMYGVQALFKLVLSSYDRVIGWHFIHVY